MQYTYLDAFSTAQNSFWTLRWWHLLVLLLFFVSSLSLWGLFSPGETNKQKTLLRARLGKYESHTFFLVKNCWTLSMVWAGTLINHPSWNGQTHWKSLQKNSLKLNAASRNNVSWYTHTDGLLEHSSSGGSLYYRPSLRQKIILGFFWFPPHTLLKGATLKTNTKCLISTMFYMDYNTCFP